MTTQQLRAMTISDLKKELLVSAREQFNLRMQRASGQAPKPHQFSKVRKQIARLKTLITEKGKQA
jgi:large subunit ribosomal protein L29